MLYAGDCEMNIKIVCTKNGDKKRKIPKHQLRRVGSVGLLFAFHSAYYNKNERNLKKM